MRCPRPRASEYVHGQPAMVACGDRDCLACQETRDAYWQVRLLLEAQLHQLITFLTLTYSNDQVPLTDEGRMTLRKRDWQLFMKRFRKLCDQAGLPRLRFYAQGEYSPGRMRPHYHAVLYGVSIDSKQRQCRYAELLRKAWKAGHVDAEPVKGGALQYVTTYHVGRAHFTPEKLRGREAPFHLMSRNPGIGADITPLLARLNARPEIRAHGEYWEDPGRPGLATWEQCETPDVRDTVRVRGRTYQLPQYLLDRVRDSLQLPKLIREGRARRVRPRMTIAELGEASNRERRRRKQLQRAGKLP